MDNLKKDYDFLFKTLVIGEASIGKKSLIVRFTDQVFQEQQNFCDWSVDFKLTRFDVQGKSVKMIIWNPSSQEKFREVQPICYKRIHGFFLSYDITNRYSFIDIEFWYKGGIKINNLEIQKYATEDFVCLLVGNKSDLEKNRQVTQEEGRQLANKLEIIFFEVSSKTNANINEAFMTLTEEIIKKQEINKMKHEQLLLQDTKKLTNQNRCLIQ